MKETNPIDVAKYATASGIEKEPLFAWWVPYTLRKRDVIVSEVSLRVWKYSHKYGIDIPTSIAHAKGLDKKNGNFYWMDSTTKEMKNIVIMFNFMEEGQKSPQGWTKASGHIIFDANMYFT